MVKVRVTDNNGKMSELSTDVLDIMHMEMELGYKVEILDKVAFNEAWQRLEREDGDG